jgi:transcription elongation GreA/GreB family factor
MSASAELKQKVFSRCVELLDEKIRALYAALNDLTEGAGNDAKSSAGDKHETARAMMQIEHENLSRQLNEFLKEKNELAQIDIGRSNTVTKGSLIKTNQGYLFLSIALGRVEADLTKVMALSPQSPLGKKLVGLTKGDSVDINGVKYEIEEVV